MKKLARIQVMNGELEALDNDIEQARLEMSMLDHIDDDAQRDAAVSGTYDDRAGAKMTHADVVRISTHIATLERSRAKIVVKRDRLVAKLVEQ